MKFSFPFLFLLSLLFTQHISAQKVMLSYYLPDDVSYNSDIPTPEAVLGYQIGEWHISHDQLVRYLYVLDEASDRITISEYARTHEARPLLLLTISSPSNQANIKNIQQEHIKLSDPKASVGLDIKSMPSVVYQGYSIHGNESSGANAAVLYAYYLAAAKGDKIDEYLKNTVILLDPCMNPDGLNRFASWVNSHKSLNIVSDPNTREHIEAWPRGRTNHYWFDLNRDWLLVQQPESQGKLVKYHEWKPNILTDHHEMGANSTFFFQPGVPSRTNPLTPQGNQDLTAKIGEYHAKKLDAVGSLYYSEESFDDFYYGKGSTYPDANGCVGILFEQASSRGHAQDSENGKLTFPFTIRNQFLTSLSTLEAANDLRVELLDFQRKFYISSLLEAKKDREKAFIFGHDSDPVRLNHFVELLLRHQIQVHALKEDIKVGKHRYKAEKAYVVPTNQNQYRLIKAIFEERTKFKDSLFYDVSSWTMPHAFNVTFDALSNKNVLKTLGKNIQQIQPLKSTIIGGESNYAYAFRWDNYNTPYVLNKILNQGLVSKVASSEFSSMTSKGQQDFEVGTVIIPVQNQGLSSAQLHRFMKEVIKEKGIEVYALSTGLTSSGIDLGSPSFKKLRQPKALLIVGSGVNGYDAGEVWHLLDQRYGMELSIVEASRLNNIQLQGYNTLIFSHGGYDKINFKTVSNIKTWVNNGGSIIGVKNGVKWLKNNGLANISFKYSDSNKKSKRPYGKQGRDAGAQYIGGAIFETQLDLTHPLAYGFNRSTLPVFRRGTLFFEPSENPYATPLQYTKKPLLAGYISKPNLKELKNSAAIVVSSIGRGKVICMADNPNFRAFWYGTNKLFANALFFGHTIGRSTTETSMPKKK